MLFLLQTPAPTPLTYWELIRISSLETKIVLVITVVFSLVSWFLIGLKGWQFRRIHRQGERLFRALEAAPKLHDAYRVVLKLKPSPYSRLFREGMGFYNELRPGVVKEGPTERIPLPATQLEVLKMILGKEVAAERDHAARFIPWLATVGSTSVLLGLLGTVLGVMDAFIGIGQRGSGNISAVAPGIAQALVATVAGLAAAIPAVMAYNLFASKTSQFEGELEGFAHALVGWMAREGWL